MKGWIKLHRKIVASDTWNQATPQRKVIMMTLLIWVGHKDTSIKFDNGFLELKAGEVLMSQRELAEKCGNGVTENHVKTGLKWLEKMDFITIKMVKKRTQLCTQDCTQDCTHHRTQVVSLITIVKYSDYQHTTDNLTQLLTQERTQELTQERPLNKNIEEIKEEKKEEDLSFSGENFKQPLSQKLKAAMLEKKPYMFFDDSEDLPTLHKLGKKIKELVKIGKKEQGYTEFGATDDNAVVYFNYLVEVMTEWELKNRFSPKGITSMLIELVNRCKEEAAKKPKSQSYEEVIKQFHNLITSDNVHERKKRINK